MSRVSSSAHARFALDITRLVEDHECQVYADKKLHSRARLVCAPFGLPRQIASGVKVVSVEPERRAMTIDLDLDLHLRMGYRFAADRAGLSDPGAAEPPVGAARGSLLVRIASRAFSRRPASSGMVLSRVGLWRGRLPLAVAALTRQRKPFGLPEVIANRMKVNGHPVLRRDGPYRLLFRDDGFTAGVARLPFTQKSPDVRSTASRQAAL